MPEQMRTLDEAKEGLGELGGVASELKKAIDLGKEQATTRDGVVQTVNDMCDALQLAADLIAAELSSQITEFNRARGQGEDVLRGYFERLSYRVSAPTLRELLHDGRVCGDLHKVGDRFRTPFSPQSVAGLGVLDTVRAFFTRSSRMSDVIHGLLEGERDYLRDFSGLLDEIRIRAEAAAMIPWGDTNQLEKAGTEIVELIRRKRHILLGKVSQVRESADGVIQALH
jgi:hypothetical protein